MAGMFYSLEEVIEKLGKTEAEIKKLVIEGKLREFRDGAKQLYKTEDVDAILAAPQEGDSVSDDSLQLAIDETGEISLAPEELDALTSEEESPLEFKLDETGELMAEEPLGKSGEDLLLSSDETKTDEKSGGSGAESGTDIFLQPEEPEPAAADDDTKVAMGADSISVLGDSDTEFRISDDTAGDTKLVGSAGVKSLDDIAGDDLSVDRLDADVNLESGGSGSGLLDLSLQADDTSLGAVLDDIYTDSPAAAESPADGGLAAMVEPEAEPVLAESEEPGTPEETAVKELIDSPETISIPTAAAGPVLVAAEAEADAASNAFGFSLFIPLALLVYTWAVVGSAGKNIQSLKMLSGLESKVWFLAAGAGVAVILIILFGSVMSAGAGKPKKEKKVKVKKEKKPKVKKEKKPKKEKKAKKKKGKKGEEEYTEE
ncbi:MAG: hypothetical protein JW806_02535 [Sedimentisphaerales bacterium]|nr:hypothetical protein [Sedimentisphaerales bacterium]